jgi:hypothetical protein
VVAGIVNHDHSSFPPLCILGIKISHKLCEKKSESIAVGLAYVHRVKHLAITGESSNQIHPLEPTGRGDHILLLCRHPPP